jgi:Predicted membrane protein (DUF2232)
MTASGTAVPQKKTWRRLVVALVFFLAVPLIPQLRVVFPLEQTLMLLVAMVASCAVIGWRQGGRLSATLTWLLLAVALLAWPSLPPGAQYVALARGWLVPSGSAYMPLARGWTLLLAASFGLVGLFGATQSFISRALSGLALAAGVGFALVLTAPGGPTRIAGTMTAEYSRRNAESIAQLHEGANTQPWKDQVDKSPAIQQLNQLTEQELLAIPKWSSLLVPAVLALESLAAMAIAWSLYHRLRTTPIGPTLGRLRDFRFNDQLVWGVAVGASMYLLPAFAEGKNAGLNILAFFGFLYVLRGLGILGWISNGKVWRLALAIFGSFVFAVILADSLGFLISPVFPIAALAFALGLGDTWLDWRKLFHAKAL